LGIWVKNTRARWNELSEDQEAELDNREFVWDAKKALWDEHYRELVEYKSINGGCNVPQKYKGLGRWVNKQRREMITRKPRQRSLVLKRRRNLKLNRWILPLG